MMRRRTKNLFYLFPLISSHRQRWWMLPWRSPRIFRPLTALLDSTKSLPSTLVMHLVLGLPHSFHNFVSQGSISHWSCIRATPPQASPLSYFGARVDVFGSRLLSGLKIYRSGFDGDPKDSTPRKNRHTKAALAAKVARDAASSSSSSGSASTAGFWFRFLWPPNGAILMV